MAEHRSHKPCTKFFAPESNCKYGDTCHFSHTKVTEGKIRCYKCGIEATGIDEIMLHRKAIHGQNCRNARTNTCKFDQNTCYLNHPSDKGREPESPRNERRPEDFREARPPLPPDPKPAPGDQAQLLLLQQMMAAIARMADSQTKLAESQTKMADSQTKMADSQTKTNEILQNLCPRGEGPWSRSSH